MIYVRCLWYVLVLLLCVSNKVHASFFTTINYAFAQLNHWQSPAQPDDTSDYVEEIKAKKGMKTKEVSQDARLSKLMQRKTVEISKLLEKVGAHDVSDELKLVFASIWYDWLKTHKRPFTKSLRDQIEAWEREELDKKKDAPDFEIYSTAAIRKSDKYAAHAAMPFKIIFALIVAGISYYAYKKYRQKKSRQVISTMM